MRKFSHQETLVIAFNIIYVASFVALLAFITTNAKETEVMWGGFDFIPSKNRETEPPYFIEFNGSPGTGHLNEFNDINIFKLFIDTFKNRENWR